MQINACQTYPRLLFFSKHSHNYRCSEKIYAKTKRVRERGSLGKLTLLENKVTGTIQHPATPIYSHKPESSLRGSHFTDEELSFEGATHLVPS